MGALDHKVGRDLPRGQDPKTQMWSAKPAQQVLGAGFTSHPTTIVVESRGTTIRLPLDHVIFDMSQLLQAMKKRWASDVLRVDVNPLSLQVLVDYAECRVAAASGATLAHGLATSAMFTEDLADPPRIVDGTITIGSLPGLGVTPG